MHWHEIGGNSEIGCLGSLHSPFDRLRTNGFKGSVGGSLPTPFGDFPPNTPLRTNGSRGNARCSLPMPFGCFLAEYTAQDERS